MTTVETRPASAKTPPDTEKLRTKLSRYLPRGALPLLAVLVIWELIGDADSFTFPKPSTWLKAIQQMHERGELLGALSWTLRMFFLSLAIAIVLGSVLGAAIGASARVERALTPIMDFFRSLPASVIVPVAALVLGITFQATVVVVVLAIVWPILLNSASAMREVPRVRLEMARSLGLKPIPRFLKVTLPSLMPGIITGTRVAVSVSLVVTLLADIFGSGMGAGRLLYERKELFDAEGVWALLLIIGVMGYLLNVLLTLVERYILRLGYLVHDRA